MGADRPSESTALTVTSSVEPESAAAGASMATVAPAIATQPVPAAPQRCHW